MRYTLLQLEIFGKLRVALTVAVVSLAVLGFLRTTTESGAAMPEKPKSRQEWKAEYVRPSAIPFPENNPYSAGKDELGQLLFFDPRLSGSNNISCATCHNPGFSWGDGLPTGFGDGMTRLGRRTPTILNAAWVELLMWDGRFETLEEQSLGPMSAAAEMNQDISLVVEELAAIPGYRTLFDSVFPEEGMTLETIAMAIATYERTIVSGVAPFDRWIAGEEDAVSEAAKRGFDLFNGKGNCAECHTGWNMTDHSFHDVGLPGDDIGRGNAFPNNPKLQHAFKTPTLRNVSRRMPYMHDGSLPDLMTVVEHYNKGGAKRPSLSDKMKPLDLSLQEKRDLVAFLRTLDGEDEPTVVPRLPTGSSVARADAVD